MAWTDSHCHVPYEGIGTDVIELARQAGVTRMVNIGTDAGQSATAVAVAQANEGVWATVGLHPHDAKNGVDTILHLLGERKVVGIGECGLDYHYDHSPRAVQREAFAAQIALARERDLALVIHTREAWDDTFAVLRAEGVPERTVFHCFTGGRAEAQLALDLGTCLSFSGILTFTAADDLRAAAALCPLDRLLVETDAPFLAPVPYRGQKNQPAYVTVVGAAVAEVKGLPVEDVEAATWATAERVFQFL